MRYPMQCVLGAGLALALLAGCAGADGSVSLTILRDGEQLEQTVELGGEAGE